MTQQVVRYLGNFLIEILLPKPFKKVQSGRVAHGPHTPKGMAIFWANYKIDGWPRTFFKKNWANPGLFSIYFRPLKQTS